MGEKQYDFFQILYRFFILILTPRLVFFSVCVQRDLRLVCEIALHSWFYAFVLHSWFYAAVVSREHITVAQYIIGLPLPSKYS